uniref:Uncharacterized protein n=1 Tax=Rhizophora mucronata TaxID=61149 RepID=A0A2P2PCF5_RHIMU
MGKIAPECFDKFVEIVENCVRDKGIERPSMHDVMETLKFALELQEAADAKKQEKDQGVENVHQEVSYNVPRYTNVIGSSESEYSGSTSTLGTLDTNTSGWNFSLESGSITTCQTSSEIINTAA